jgi:hypothetical protein
MAHRIDLKPETWHALDDLSRASRRPLHDLAEEAFSDLLRKRRRPRSLRQALREAGQRRGLGGRLTPGR